MLMLIKPLSDEIIAKIVSMLQLRIAQSQYIMVDFDMTDFAFDGQCIGGLAKIWHLLKGMSSEHIVTRRSQINQMITTVCMECDRFFILAQTL